MFVARQVMAAGGADDPNADMMVFHRFVTVAAVSTNCLISALAVMLLYLFGRRLGASDAAALFGSGALALATPYFAWSSTFFAHPMSGNFLLFGAMIVGWHGRAEDGSPLGRGLALGLLFGFLMVIEPTAAPAAALIALWGLLRSQGRGRELAGLVAGGVVGIAPLLVYDLAVFGSPFRLGYSQVGRRLCRDAERILRHNAAGSGGAGRTAVRTFSWAAAAVAGAGAGAVRTGGDVEGRPDARAGDRRGGHGDELPADQCQLLLLGRRFVEWAAAP